MGVKFDVNFVLRQMIRKMRTGLARKLWTLRFIDVLLLHQLRVRFYLIVAVEQMSGVFVELQNTNAHHIFYEIKSDVMCNARAIKYIQIITHRTLRI